MTIAVVSSLVVLSCQNPRPTDSFLKTKTLTIPEYQKLSSLDPRFATTTLSSLLTDVIFDSLTEFDDSLQIQPHLASSWELSPDQLTWTLHLRKGVQFHDGVELTADDVKFTINQLRENAAGNEYLYTAQDISDVIVKDKYTVQVVLKKKMSSFLSSLNIGILPRHLLDKRSDPDFQFSQYPIGTGPFKVVDSRENGVVLEANTAYFLGRPALDRIIVKVYPDKTSVWADLISGNVDFFHIVDPADYDRLRHVPTFKTYRAPRFYYYLLSLNLRTPFFEDRRVRQALNYAINKEDIIAKTLKGYGHASTGTIYPKSWAYNSAMHPYEYNPRKALALLEEAGWRDHDGDHLLDKNGRRFEFTVFTNRGDDLKLQVLLIVQQQLLDLGIKMRVKVFDANDTDFLFRKQFDAFFPEIDAGGDPDLNYRYWHSSQIKVGFNVGSYHNPRVDQLLDVGRIAFDRTKRKAIYDAFQRNLFDDPPGIFLFWIDYLVGVNRRFTGVKISSAGPFAHLIGWRVEDLPNPS